MFYKKLGKEGGRIELGWFFNVLHVQVCCQPKNKRSFLALYSQLYVYCALDRRTYTQQR